jgi:sugar-specific transcriptional regulator TrmB
VTDDNERALGRVEGKLEALITQVAASERSSSEGRAKLYEAVDGLREGIRAMQAEVKTMDKRLEAVEPITSDLQRWRERGIGVLLFLSVVAAALGALITALWDKALHLIGLK